MFSWEIFEKDSVNSMKYIHTMQQSFSKLSNHDFYNGNNIGIFYNNALVGGATLKEIDNIQTDPDISRHWKSLQTISGTRILRLWSKDKSGTKNIVPYIFKAIIEKSKGDTFFYGILSLPLEFSKEKERLFSSHLGYLTPKLQIEQCNWNPKEAPSSEGWKLLKAYIRLGAKFLGPASGNPEDKSIRVVMGMHQQNADLTKLHE